MYMHTPKHIKLPTHISRTVFLCLQDRRGSGHCWPAGRTHLGFPELIFFLYTSVFMKADERTFTSTLRMPTLNCSDIRHILQ